jgi:hypothetical protein
LAAVGAKRSIEEEKCLHASRIESSSSAQRVECTQYRLLAAETSCAASRAAMPTPP